MSIPKEVLDMLGMSAAEAEELGFDDVADEIHSRIKEEEERESTQEELNFIATHANDTITTRSGAKFGRVNLAVAMGDAVFIRDIFMENLGQGPHVMQQVINMTGIIEMFGGMMTALYGRTTIWLPDVVAELQKEEAESDDSTG